LLSAAGGVSTNVRAETSNGPSANYETNFMFSFVPPTENKHKKKKYFGTLFGVEIFHHVLYKDLFNL
jgi:hypothetical protein